MSSQAPSYRGYRFPSEIISYAVWLYHRFSLSFRDAEDLLAQRGITVTYETIRQWCLTFGPTYARTLRRHRGRLGDTWYLDEVFATIQGQRRYLWRAVDQDGDLLDILVQSRRDRRAAIRFFRNRGVSAAHDTLLIDVGIGLYRIDDSLAGTIRTTLCCAKRHQHAESCIDMAGDEAPGEYERNTQLAELNALNAALAVIRWKKARGFYNDLAQEFNCEYIIDGNRIINSYADEAS